VAARKWIDHALFSLCSARLHGAQIISPSRRCGGLYRGLLADPPKQTTDRFGAWSRRNPRPDQVKLRSPFVLSTWPRTANPVAGAVLFKSKTDKGAERMAEMAGNVKPPALSDQPGILVRFPQVDDPAWRQRGSWRFGAKVQGPGRPGTLRGTVL